MASTDARPIPLKNTAYRHYFAIRKNDGTLITSWAGADSEVDKDAGGFTDCTNEATETGTSGCGYIDLTSTEMNADAVTLKVTVTNTGAVPVVVHFFPEETGDINVDVTAFGGTAATTASGIPEVKVASLAASAITAATIASDAITSVKIQDAALTADKFASGAFDAVWSVATRTLTSISGLGIALATAVQNVLDRLSTTPLKTAAVVDDAGNSATTFKTDLTETADDHYKDCLLKLTSGDLAEQVKKITAYNGTTKFVTVDGGFTAEPAADDAFEIVND